MSFFSRFLRSFRHARHGLFQAVAMENSFRIHLAVAVVIVLVLIGLRVPPLESAMIIFVISSILMLELVNTVVERFVDILEPRIHPYAGLIKDLLAAAVLIMSVSAAVIGCLLLWPYALRVLEAL